MEGQARLNLHVGMDSIQVVSILLKTQTQEVRTFLQSNKERLSDLLGFTNINEHSIITKLGFKVCVSISEAQRKTGSDELKKMLALRVIEKLQSLLSTIVLVPKSNSYSAVLQFSHSGPDTSTSPLWTLQMDIGRILTLTRGAASVQNNAIWPSECSNNLRKQ